MAESPLTAESRLLMAQGTQADSEFGREYRSQKKINSLVANAYTQSHNQLLKPSMHMSDLPWQVQQKMMKDRSQQTSQRRPNTTTKRHNKKLNLINVKSVKEPAKQINDRRFVIFN